MFTVEFLHRSALGGIKIVEFLHKSAPGGKPGLSPRSSDVESLTAGKKIICACMVYACAGLTLSAITSESDRVRVWNEEKNTTSCNSYFQTPAVVHHAKVVEADFAPMA
jgi:hypothetical protein